jgi:hypothetical protein
LPVLREALLDVCVEWCSQRRVCLSLSRSARPGRRRAEPPDLQRDRQHQEPSKRQSHRGATPAPCGRTILLCPGRPNSARLLAPATAALFSRRLPWPSLSPPHDQPRPVAQHRKGIPHPSKNTLRKAIVIRRGDQRRSPICSWRYGVSLERREQAKHRRRPQP